MDALNGLRPAQEGMVFYNGVDYYHHMAAFNTQLGYVPQDDIVHRELTVERALYYAARLRLPEDFTRKQIQWRIETVLEDVEMTDRRGLFWSASFLAVNASASPLRWNSWQIPASFSWMSRPPASIRAWIAK